ncbi:E3 ubiquitin-protein ligase Godzilla-like isoform X2 [Macrosteles quadrilineatus]|uniref:E3 ubiquitin-protein ligase Godzilla-like isoform X2 n=1 Tax=Macrosteles quadrilineatus TaxID=74068 RepID=UPI0023E2F61F|nr:E3 ubiquitin-protein ligase Godzilla-like isoform X2 [Macrosteles quadrilineatus]
MLYKIDLVVLASWLTCVTADITVYTRSTHRQLDVEFRDVPARFGMSIPPEGLRAFLVYADPPDACSNMTRANLSIPNFTGRWAVLIKRYGCLFEDKVRNAQAANFDIAIIHNVNSSELEPMSANNPIGIHIAAVFVSEQTGLVLKDNYIYNEGYYIIVDDDSPFDINTHLLYPFAVVVGLCFCTMLGFMVVKCIKDYRRARRHRLPASSLRKIPIAKFRKGDPYETCAICLDDFIEKEELRILPCSHAYHTKCIDPWLTRNRRVCPVCKRKVFAADEARPTASDSDSDSEVDDRTPLVRANNTSTQGGTFSNSFLSNTLRPLISGRRSASEVYNTDAGPSNAAPSIQQPGEVQAVAEVNPEVHVSTSRVEGPNPFADMNI